MIYSIIHVVLGIVSNTYKPMDKIFLAYQVGQMLLDIRYFFFENKIKEGNSYFHTLKKLLEYSLGKLITI
jgi:hypothetical protein